MTQLEEINDASNFLLSRGFGNPEMGIILGTGLGELLKEISIEQCIPYDQIPHFPAASVEFHKGELVSGLLKGKHILAMHGRYHFYEGYSFHQITLPIRVMKLLGIKCLVITSACGALNPEFSKGSLMLIDDHINLLPGNPLIGPNLDVFGPRFPDMSQPYTEWMNIRLAESARQRNILLHRGVYVAMPGPMLETPAEYRYLRKIGADAVGMSTVPEVIVANHMGLPCAAIGVITDECNPDDLEKINVQDLLDTARKTEADLLNLVSDFVESLD
ncbi:MAG: purine-nucleoside phosphorylase [Bacteroidales bacterium]|nr:purine-nucleoside phosphorylase [Lentimicrobiaceae bacterium]MDD5695246.1 purine-nucleoside phosphorylase [Bacteroidales bacterium]